MTKFKKFPNIAKFIQHYREYADLSQQELSTKLGYINGQFVSNIERGLCSIPVKKYKTLCKILNVFPEELEQVLMLDHAFAVKRSLYPERINSLLKEYEACNQENTNSSPSRVN